MPPVPAGESTRGEVLSGVRHPHRGGPSQCHGISRSEGRDLWPEPLAVGIARPAGGHEQHSSRHQQLARGLTASLRSDRRERGAPCASVVGYRAPLGRPIHPPRGRAGGPPGSAQLLGDESPWLPNTTSGTGRCIATGTVTHVPDVDLDPAADTATRELARKRGWRSDLNVPMLCKGSPIGALSHASKRRRLAPPRSGCCRPSPTRPSSPSRTYGCSRSFSHATAI